MDHNFNKKIMIKIDVLKLMHLQVEMAHLFFHLKETLRGEGVNIARLISNIFLSSGNPYLHPFSTQAIPWKIKNFSDPRGLEY